MMQAGDILAQKNAHCVCRFDGGINEVVKGIPIYRFLKVFIFCSAFRMDRCKYVGQQRWRL